MYRRILLVLALAFCVASNLLCYSMTVRLLHGEGLPIIDQGRMRIFSLSGIAIHMTVLAFSLRMLCRKQPDETGVVIPLLVCLLTVVCHWSDAYSNWEQFIIILIYAFGLFVLTSTAIICCFGNITLSAEKSTTGVVCETNDASRGTVSNTDTS